MSAEKFSVSGSTFRSSSSGVAGAAAAVVLMALALAGVIPASASARATGVLPDGGVKEVNIFFRSPTNQRKVFELNLFPTKGVAVVATYEGGADGGHERAVGYAIAIPPAPFASSVNLKFPGLGEVVGTVTPDDRQTSAAQAKLCKSDYPGEGARFEGHLAFRGAGGYGRWSATKAQAGILLACGAEPMKENGPAALFRHVAAEHGPVLNGPAPIRLFAQGEVRHRVIEFIAFAGHASGAAEFVAVDREWLPGGVATERWAKERPVSLKETVALGVDSRNPPSATFTPPAPFFFGKGTYRRSTGNLTGSIGVNFLGRRLRLTPSPIDATLIDEDTPQAR